MPKKNADPFAKQAVKMRENKLTAVALPSCTLFKLTFSVTGYRILEWIAEISLLAIFRSSPLDGNCCGRVSRCR
jgi:hypothetical protein